MKLLTLAALAAVAISAPAQAATSVAVRMADLNLANSRDAAIALRRIDIGAAAACGAERGSVRVNQVAVRRSDCYGHAMRAALTDLSSPTVDALHHARGPVIASR